MRRVALALFFSAGCRFTFDDVPTGPNTPTVVRHSACRQAFDAARQPPLATLTDATGRPHFDRYRDLPCAQAAVDTACDEERCAACLAIDDGVCVARMPADPALVSAQDDTCFAVLDVSVKARLCCDDVEQVDCRPWPFVEKSELGQLCGAHADCEPGLACVAIPGAPGLGGLCRCPEAGQLAEPFPAFCEAPP